MSKNISTPDVAKQLKAFLGQLNTYRGFIFFIILTSLYAFVVWRINVLSSAPPSEAALKSATQSVPRPKISTETIQKLKSLQDNSVRVQTLFNEARQNPFQ